MKSSTKYPYFNEKGSIHLMETIHKDGFVCAFEGGDLFKRKNVFKHDEIETSLKFLYSKLVKLEKIKKKFKKFYWLIKYYVPNENQIKDFKKNKKYKHDWKKTAHILEPLYCSYNNHKKINISSDLFVEGKKDSKYKYGKKIESIILASKLLTELKQLNFKLGFLNRGLPYGWLKSNMSQDKYIREKLGQWGWFTPKIDIKNRIIYPPTGFKSLKKDDKDTIKVLDMLKKHYQEEVKDHEYGTDLKALQYLRKKIDPKIKFTFYKLDKIEKKILKKYKII